jgi:hypothetical protein
MKPAHSFEALYGILIEFSEADPLLKAARVASVAGFRHMDAYCPFPVEELAETIGLKKDRVALFTLIGGVSGGILAFFMQWYANVVDYPINVGGRPDFSWPAFIPVTFELTILGAALSTAVGMLALNRLPRFRHPTFNSSAFSRASRDRFFLCIQAKDPQFDPIQIRALFENLHPISIEEVKLEDIF